MATVNIAYTADVALTIDTTALVPSSTFVSGRESSWMDNTTTKYVDCLLMGTVTLGTTVITARSVLIYVVAAIGDGPEYPDVFDGTTSDETLTSVGIGSGFLKLAAVCTTDGTTASRVHPFGPVSVAQLFGGVMPNHWCIFVAHNTNDTAVALGATVARYLPITYTVA